MARLATQVTAGWISSQMGRGVVDASVSFPFPISLVDSVNVSRGRIVRSSSLSSQPSGTLISPVSERSTFSTVVVIAKSLIRRIVIPIVWRIGISQILVVPVIVIAVVIVVPLVGIIGIVSPIRIVVESWIWIVIPKVIRIVVVSIIE